MVQVPRGFYETRQRIRAAYEVREKVLQQREDGGKPPRVGRAAKSGGREGEEVSLKFSVNGLNNPQNQGPWKRRGTTTLKNKSIILKGFIR